jgi:DNA-binding CsgD family transcriptional regulator/pimeloyl-ACP methyl ester carboxylesterase
VKEQALPNRREVEAVADTVGDVADLLREGVTSGRPILALLDVWGALEAFASRDEDALFDILTTAAQLPPSIGASAAIAPEQAGVALASRAGAIVWADERFRHWIGDAAGEPSLRGLVRQAYAGKPAVQLIATDSQAAFPVLAAPLSAASKWRELAPPHEEKRQSGEVIVLAFAPSRAKGLIVQAARAVGLSPLEAELSATLMEEPSVESAAYRMGLGFETARDAMRSAMKRTGARTAPQLIGRIIDLGSGMAHRSFKEPNTADALLGLTPSELRLARLLADGMSAGAAAAEAGLSAETVKSYRRSIFAKLGINRTRTLRRLMTETRALQALSEAGEVRWDRPVGGNLRVLVGPRGRSIALIDYGPASGRPVLLFHGSSTGRLAAPPMLAALSSRGFRVIVPQRPGFGLTSPGGLDDGVDDLALVCERLAIGPVDVIARDGGVALAMAFAAGHPSRIGRGVMLNPRRPSGAARSDASPINAMTALLLKHPRLADPYARMLTRQTRSDLLGRLLSGVYQSIEADRVCAENADVIAHLIADLRGLVGRSSEGFAAEHRLFAEGWRPPTAFDPRPWTFVFSGALWPPADLAVWRAIAGEAIEIISGAGQLVQFTHPETIVRALAGPSETAGP